MPKLSLISIILGVVLLGAAGYMTYTQQQSLSSGVQTEATIESKEVIMSSSKRGDSYTPNITYSYTYNGTQYTSDNITPGIGTKASDTRTAAEDRIDQYNVGETTTAYVVQGSPSKSYLEKRSNPLPLIIGVLGLALVGLPVYKSAAS